MPRSSESVKAGASAKPTFVGELAAEPLPRRQHDLGVVEGEPGKIVDDAAAVSAGSSGSTSAGTRSRKAVGELAPVGMALGLSLPRPELFQVRQLTHVHLSWPAGAGSTLPASRRSRPAGRAQAPLKGLRARCQSSACRRPSRTCRTTARTACAGCEDRRQVSASQSKTLVKGSAHAPSHPLRAPALRSRPRRLRIGRRGGGIDDRPDRPRRLRRSGWD